MYLENEFLNIMNSFRISCNFVKLRFESTISATSQRGPTLTHCECTTICAVAETCEVLSMSTRKHRHGRNHSAAHFNGRGSQSQGLLCASISPSYARMPQRTREFITQSRTNWPPLRKTLTGRWPDVVQWLSLGSGAPSRSHNTTGRCLTNFFAVQRNAELHVSVSSMRVPSLPEESISEDGQERKKKNGMGAYIKHYTSAAFEEKKKSIYNCTLASR